MASGRAPGRSDCADLHATRDVPAGADQHRGQMGIQGLRTIGVCDHNITAVPAIPAGFLCNDHIARSGCIYRLPAAVRKINAVESMDALRLAYSVDRTQEISSQVGP